MSIRALWGADPGAALSSRAGLPQTGALHQSPKMLPIHAGHPCCLRNIATCGTQQVRYVFGFEAQQEVSSQVAVAPYSARSGPLTPMIAAPGQSLGSVEAAYEVAKRPHRERDCSSRNTLASGNLRPGADFPGLELELPIDGSAQRPEAAKPVPVG